MKYVFFILALFGCGVCQAGVYTTIDNRAMRMPNYDTPAELVDHLTKNLTEDKDKARAIAAWIVYQVQRDNFRHRELIKFSNQNRPAPAPIPNNVFKSRIGTPQEFAQLFLTLAQLAGLEAVVIDGYEGRDIPAFRYKDAAYQAGEVLLDFWRPNLYPMQRYVSAWNAVQIDGEWKLIDTYMMIANDKLYGAKNIQTERDMKRFIKLRENRTPGRGELTHGKEINDDYFLANPHFFVKTHFPFNPEWQLFYPPWTWATFTNQ